MKKIALIFASLALAAAPAFACPHENKTGDAPDNAPRTAEKDKAKEQPKAKETDKGKAKEGDKTAKPTEKKSDKVSSK
jgi:hypothetical protein